MFNHKCKRFSGISLTFKRFDHIVTVRCGYDKKTISESISAIAATGSYMLFLRAELRRQPPEIQPFSLENQLSAVSCFVVADAGCALRPISDLVDDYHIL